MTKHKSKRPHIKERIDIQITSNIPSYRLNLHYRHCNQNKKYIYKIQQNINGGVYGGVLAVIWGRFDQNGGVLTWGRFDLLPFGTNYRTVPITDKL